MIKLNLSRKKLGLICAWGPYVSELGGSFAPSLVLMTGPRQRPPGLVAGDLIARRRLAGRSIPATRARALRLYGTSATRRFRSWTCLAVGWSVATTTTTTAGAGATGAFRCGAGVRNRARGRRGNRGELTAGRRACSAGSREDKRRWGVAGDLGRPGWKTTSMAAIRCAPGCMARRGRCRRRGGALEHNRWVGEGWWPRWTVSAATSFARS